MPGVAGQAEHGWTPAVPRVPPPPHRSSSSSHSRPARSFLPSLCVRPSDGLHRPADRTSARDHRHTRRRGPRRLCPRCEHTMGRALAAARLRAPHSHCRWFVERNSDCCTRSDIPSDASCIGTGEHSAAMSRQTVAPAQPLCSLAALLPCCVLLLSACLRRCCLEPMQRARPTVQESVQTPAWQ